MEECLTILSEAAKNSAVMSRKPSRDLGVGVAGRRLGGWAIAASSSRRRVSRAEVGVAVSVPLMVDLGEVVFRWVRGADGLGSGVCGAALLTSRDVTVASAHGRGEAITRWRKRPDVLEFQRVEMSSRRV